MDLCRLGWRRCTKEAFVVHWAASYPDTKEHLYTQNIDGPLTPASVLSLFEWKNGTPLAPRKRESVERNYIARLDELTTLPVDLPGEEFLRRWPDGGAIWRIFWLHCWSPGRFPIYDQHVYRAAAKIQGWAEAEIPSSDARKVATYFDLYVPFWKRFRDNTRDADRALWTFGKFTKSWPVLVEGYDA